MIKTSYFKFSWSFIVALAFILIFMPLVSASSFCDCDDLDDDVEWVSVGTVTAQWGKLGYIIVDEVEYKFRPDDFNDDLKSVLLSSQRAEGEVRSEFLFLEAADEDKWFHWDHDIKVVLTGITQAGDSTPSASFEIFKRGKPELEITFSSESDEVDGVSVAEDQYAPGEEKRVFLEVKNSGDAWVESVLINVDLNDFRLREKGEFEYFDKVMKKNIGCLEVGESKKLNFTVVAPKWDGRTSPYELNYAVNASAGGYDIKGAYYESESDDSMIFHCTDPELKVELELVTSQILEDGSSSSTINMTSWFSRSLDRKTSTWQSSDFEIWNAWETAFLRTNIYNIGLYDISNPVVSFSEIPRNLLINEVHESGDYGHITPEGQYYLGQRLIPIRQGEYTFQPVKVDVNFFGKDFSWKSDSQSLTVNGADVSLKKSLSQTGDDYTITLEVKNHGNRAAWVKVCDHVPEYVTYVGNSLEESLAGEKPLSEWDWSVTRQNSSLNFSVDGVLLAPGETFAFDYQVSSDESPDLPYATCEFRSIPNYEGELRSSFFVAGAEHQQHLDLSTGKWVNDTVSVPIPIVDPESELENDEDILHSTDDESELVSSEYSLGVEDADATPSFFSKILDSIGGTFEKIHKFVGSTFGKTLDSIASLFGVAENAAIDAVENYLYVVIIVIALAVFAIVSTLISK